MKLSYEEVLAVINARRAQDTLVKQQMILVQRAYNGDYVIPLPDVVGSPELRAMAPQLVSDAIDNRAMAAASYLPDVFCPAGVPSQVTSMKKAMIRQRATEAWWAESRMGIVLRKYFRHLGGYATGALIVEADYEYGFPRVKLRDPLCAYPEPRAAEDVCPPSNCGFVYEKGAGDLSKMYQTDAEGNSLAGYWAELHKAGQKVEIVEWVDEDQIIIGVLGPTSPPSSPWYTGPTLGGVCLSSVPNRLGVAPVTIGHAVTLDRVQAQMVKLLPQIEWLDKILGLETIAAEKSVFPDMYAIGKEGTMPQLNGQWHDGREGVINLVGSATSIGQLVSPIGPGAAQMASTIERNVRVSSGNTGVYGGEMNGSIRSGQTINQLQAISSDPRVAELHEIAELQLEQVNKFLVLASKKVFGSKTISLYSGRQGDMEAVEYTPNDDFDSDANKVVYPFPGSDINQVTVAVGQMKGAGLMSSLQAMTVHPMVKNPQAEIRQIMTEGVEQAVLAGFAQQIASGQAPLPDAVFVLDRLRKGDDIVDAINKAHEAAQKRQAAQAPPPGPGMATDPSQQPGIASPGQGVETRPPPSVPTPPEGVDRLSQMLRAMRAPASSVAGPGPA